MLRRGDREARDVLLDDDEEEDDDEIVGKENDEVRTGNEINGETRGDAGAGADAGSVCGNSSSLRLSHRLDVVRLSPILQCRGCMCCWLLCRNMARSKEIHR